MQYLSFSVLETFGSLQLFVKGKSQLNFVEMYNIVKDILKKINFREDTYFIFFIIYIYQQIIFILVWARKSRKTVKKKNKKS